MAIALVQSTSSTPASGSTLAYTGNNTAGNLLIGVCASTAVVVPNSAFTDSAGNTWHVAQWTPEAQDIVICYAMNCLAGANTVTMSVTASGKEFFSIYEFSGLKTTSVLDQGSEGAGGIATNITTTQSGDLVFGTLQEGNSGGTAPTITPGGAGWVSGRGGSWTVGAGNTVGQRDGWIVQAASGAIGFGGWTITNASFGPNDSVLTSFFKGLITISQTAVSQYEGKSPLTKSGASQYEGKSPTSASKVAIYENLDGIVRKSGD